MGMNIEVLVERGAAGCGLLVQGAVVLLHGGILMDGVPAVRIQQAAFHGGRHPGVEQKMLGDMIGEQVGSIEALQGGAGGGRKSGCGGAIEIKGGKIGNGVAAENFIGPFAAESHGEILAQALARLKMGISLGVERGSPLLAMRASQCSG